MHFKGKYMGTLVIFRQMIVFVILIGIGIILNIKGILGIRDEKTISSIIVNVCNPMLLISSCIEEGERISHEKLLKASGAAVLIYLVLIIMGFIIPHLIGVKKEEQRFYNLMCVYGNVGFIGIPLIREILGSDALIYVTVCNLIFCILIYTHGKAVLFSGKGGFKARDLLSTGFIGGIIAILIYWFDITVPEVIAKPVNYGGAATTFLSMMVLGSSLKSLKIKEMLCMYRLHAFTALKFVVLPVVFGLTLRAAGFETIVVKTLAAVSALPVGNMPLMLAKEAGLETKTLTMGIGESTILSVITLTIVLSVV